MTEIRERLLSAVEQREWKASVVPVNHLDGLEREISDRRERGLLHDMSESFT